MKQIILAAGCFWSVQYKLNALTGVNATKAVYAGGHVPDASYSQVCSGTTGHAEAVWVEYNPELCSTKSLLQYFFSIHDPSQHNRQGPDMGEQYRSAVFYFDEEQAQAAHLTIDELSQLPRYQREPVVTQVLQAALFVDAEEQHQHYYTKRGF